jgi:uncharacterized protein YfaP (DUF2135 family)
VEVFEKGLEEYGTIIIDTHGSLTGGTDDNGDYITIPPRYSTPNQHVWIYTGETWTEEKSKKYKEYFANNRLGICDEKILFSQKLIEDFKGNIANTLFYTISCYGMHDNVFGKVMEKKRMKEYYPGVTIGYDDANNVTAATMWFFFEALLGGYTVQEAYDEILPLYCKENYVMSAPNRNPYTAYLDYYPQSGGNITLVDEKAVGSILIKSPVYGEYYSDRVVTLEGTCVGFNEGVTGTVTIGGLTLPLTFVNYNTFSQKIEIKTGNNTIKVVCSGKAEGRNTPLIAKEDLYIVGDFAELPLYTSMQWNTNGTDVDLHLVGPNGVDCYYNNKKPSWGGILDIDDTNGFGPEHITIPVLKQTGTYKLYAHYYATNGKGASQVWVGVRTPTGKRDFGPYTLTTKGQKWEICEITYSSLSPPYGATINSTGTRSGEIEIIDNMPAKKEQQVIATPVMK